MRPDDSLEQAARKRGYTLVCGCDEAGAGPLMGPVCAGAVILPPGCNIPGLDDSKKLTEKKREALYGVITERAIAWAVASVSAAEIDATDILSARIRAMALAIEALTAWPRRRTLPSSTATGITAKPPLLPSPTRRSSAATDAACPLRRRPSWPRSPGTGT